MECYARARHGLSQIEAGLPVNPEVHAVLLKICADNGTFSSEPEESWRYALAYAREAGTPFMQRAYYGAALFKLNALDLPAREVYETSRGYAELFRAAEKGQDPHRLYLRRLLRACDAVLRLAVPRGLRQ